MSDRQKERGWANGELHTQERVKEKPRGRERMRRGRKREKKQS